MFPLLRGIGGDLRTPNPVSRGVGRRGWTRYLWNSQAQRDASQQEEVTVDPVDQLVDAAIGIDEFAGLQVVHGLHALATHGVDDSLGAGETQEQLERDLGETRVPHTAMGSWVPCTELFVGRHSCCLFQKERKGHRVTASSGSRFPISSRFAQMPMLHRLSPPGLPITSAGSRMGTAVAAMHQVGYTGHLIYTAAIFRVGAKTTLLPRSCFSKAPGEGRAGALQVLACSLWQDVP